MKGKKIVKLHYRPSYLKRIRMPGVGTGNNPDGHVGILNRFGAKNGRHVLKAKDVHSIRKKHSSGKYSFIQLSKIYGVSATQISRIVNKVNWGHI